MNRADLVRKIASESDDVGLGHTKAVFAAIEAAGFWIVPVVPTLDMADAFHEANDAFQTGVGEAPDAHWVAMLEVNPIQTENAAEEEFE